MLIANFEMNLFKRVGRYLGCAVCFAGNGSDPNAAAMGNAFSWGAVLLLGATMGILGVFVYSIFQIEKKRNHPEAYELLISKSR